MKNKTIIVGGDSWASGEWVDHQLTHGGLTEYLIDHGYRVINLSCPGGSNSQAVSAIHNFLKFNPKIEILTVILFQTEWSRTEIIATDINSGYLNLKNKVISRFYYDCTTLNTIFNIPIQIVGGCSDTIWIDYFSNEYPGVSIVCQSFTNLILNNDHRISHPIYSCLNYVPLVEKLKAQIDHRDLELLLDDIENGTQRFELWKQHEKSYWPDYRHPNRHAHKILFDFLKEQNIF